MYGFKKWWSSLISYLPLFRFWLGRRKWGLMINWIIILFINPSYCIVINLQIVLTYHSRFWSMSVIILKSFKRAQVRCGCHLVWCTREACSSWCTRCGKAGCYTTMTHIGFLSPKTKIINSISSGVIRLLASIIVPKKALFLFSIGFAFRIKIIVLFNRRNPL